MLYDLKNHGNQILSFFHMKKIFSVDPIFNKENVWIVTIGKGVSEHRRVSKTKYSASIVRPGLVASKGEKMSLKRRYRLTSAIYKEVLETQVLTWIKKITKKSDYIFQQNGVPAQLNCRAGLVGRKHELLAQRILASTVTRFKPTRLQLVDSHLGKGLQGMPQQHR